MEMEGQQLVIGAGSWGTALAIHLARQQQSVWLLGRDAAQMAEMAAHRCNHRYLPSSPFPDRLTPTSILPTTIPIEAVILAVPSHAFRATLHAYRPLLEQVTAVAWATKGFERQSGQLLHQVFAEEFGDRVAGAVISGPTFASEVAQGLPTAVTVAAHHPLLIDYWVTRLHSKTFRAYACSDPLGVELGGACKNVLAVAAGIADGLGFGANTRAALISRGLAEIRRLGEAMGAQSETLMGLAGLGDLVLTCTDNQSRNRRVGLGLGRGEPLEQVIATIGQAVEGVTSAPELMGLAHRYGVEMPIAEQVYRVLYEALPPQQAVEQLLGRSARREQPPVSVLSPITTR